MVQLHSGRLTRRPSAALSFETSHRSQTVPPGRVQALRLESPLLWKRWGWARVIVNVAGPAGEDGAERPSIVLPVAPLPVARAVLAHALPGIDPFDVDVRGGAVARSLASTAAVSAVSRGCERRGLCSQARLVGAEVGCGPARPYSKRAVDAGSVAATAPARQASMSIRRRVLSLSRLSSGTRHKHARSSSSSHFARWRLGQLPRRTSGC